MTTTWQQEILDRYQKGAPRNQILYDLITTSLPQHHRPRLIDIGCGHGIDLNQELQHSLSRRGELIGIEPDTEITPATCFSSLHRCFFEQADLPHESADTIYCFMVLEHIQDPQAFWNKVHDILVPEGHFWAITVDARSLFAVISRWMDQLCLKDLYMGRVRDRNPNDHEMYPTHYRTNSPRTIGRYTRLFRESHFLSLHRVGQTAYYVPRNLRFLSKAYDRTILRLGWPGSILLVHLQK